MRSLLVIVLSPILQLFDRIRKAQEPVRIQALGPEPAVEGLDECVVRRFSRPGEVKRDASSIGPQIEIPGDELGALIDPDRIRIANLLTDDLQGSHHILTPVAETWVKRRHIARIRVDHCQNADLPAGGELVMHEIHRPHIVRLDSFLPVFAQLCLHPALGMLVPQLQAQLVVDPPRFLLIDHPALPAQQDMHPPVSEPDTRLANLSDPLFQSGLTGPTGSITVGRRVKPDHRAGTANGHRPVRPHLVDQRSFPGRPQSFRRMTS